MAKDYKQWLAAEVVTESKIVTYRMLSRELKVHVNAAKKMLYDFHQTQNARKPGSVHATYLLHGNARAKPTSPEESQQDGQDAYMQSSPFMSSSVPQEESIQELPPVKLVTLAREEHLEDAKAKYDEIHSIHIYSLEPSTITNLHILSDCNRQIRAKHANEDPLEHNKHYGTILNPNVQRKTGRRPPPPPPVAAAPAKISQPAPKAAERSSSSVKPSPAPSSQPKPPALKKEASSIFKSFSKTQPPKKQPTPLATSTSTPSQNPPAPASSSSEEDSQMPDAPALSTDSEPDSPKEKSAREASLRKMMDEPSPPNSPSPSPPLTNPPVPSKSNADPPPPSRRRHIRRQITRKKTIKDEEGYLVTKEEPAWESFSESEPEPVAAAPVKKPIGGAGSGAPKKAAPAAGGGGKGQGSIMSFFGKPKK